MIARFLVLLSLLIAAPAFAQDSDPIVDATHALDQASVEFSAVDSAFNEHTDPTERQKLIDRATAVKQASDAQVTTLAAQLDMIDARIAQLGPAPTGTSEAADIRAQRRLLAEQHSTVDSAIKRGKLLGVEADQLVNEITESQSDAFSEKMSERVASPLTPSFWRPLIHSLPRDGRRVSLFLGVEADSIRSGFASGGLLPALVGLVVALLLIGPARSILKRAGRRYVIDHVPGSRIRRSGLALWLVAVGVLLPGIAAVAFVEGVRSAGMLAPAWESVAHSFQRAAFVAALISSLGGALLQRKQSSWRLLPISDESAAGLRPWTFAATAVVISNVLLGAFREAVSASGPASAAVDSASAVLSIGLILGILVTIGRLRSRAMRAHGDDRPDQAGVAFFALAAWAVLIMAAAALLLGYVSLAYLLSRSLVWVTVVAGALYLSLIATDDIFSSLFGREGRLATVLHDGFGLRRSLVDQLGVALSAVLRLALIMVAAGFVFRPFGSNVTTLFGELGRIAQGVTIGQITISPGAILRSGGVLIAGLFIVRTGQRWLTSRYLPATELDAGARNSISMVARYTGLILAVLWSLASLGIGIERIALLLSALSVGIGFGLQAITQNFVSGLILLAERPVKIGDLVRIGDQEGDVKRISVRATEIEIADRSTLIVPNSELITKTIRNMTLADPLGRVQLKFSVPMGSDIRQVREMAMAIFHEAPAVLDTPAPSLFIDSIVDGRINLNGFAYVRSPRDAYGTRSEILFHLLDRLPAAGIELGTAPQQFHFIGHLPQTAEGEPSGS
jgi:small-conductance mechanosensitive channel